MSTKMRPTPRRRVREVVGNWLHLGRRKQAPPAARPPRNVRQAIKDAFGNDAFDKVHDSSTTMAILLGAKPVYQGTVAKAVVQRRRAANKRARIARRVHRRAAH